MKRQRAERGYASWLPWALSGIAAGLACCLLLFVNATVEGDSMLPAMRGGDRVLGLRLAYALSAPERGDIVLLRNPDVTESLIVKRVAGTAGDEVRVRGGADTDIVPEGHCYVLGDNPVLSSDSRTWESPMIPLGDIIAKVILIY